MHASKGFTLIEIIVVIAVVGILSAAGMIGMRASQSKANLDSATASLTLALESARSKALTGAGGADQGVRVEQVSPIRITSFAGNDPGFVLNLPHGIVLSSPNGTTNIVFTRLSGISNVQQTFILSAGSLQKNVTVNQNGTISVQ